MNLSDTIVAVSSPAGAGERAIVRLSGPRALEMAERVFACDQVCGPGDLSTSAGDTGRRAAGATRTLASVPTYTAWPGRLEVPGPGLSVPAVLYVMRAPRSYTRQDVVEFHVGAWPAVVPLVVEGLLGCGARAAEPGEFTLRALVSGRLDLAQAEAVMAVVNAASESALRAAGDLLRGHLSREVAQLVDEIRDVLVRVEADLDFSDQDIEAAPADEVASRIAEARRRLTDLGRRSRGLETFDGEVRLVITGRPNAGKSSLFNRLLAEDRAMVTPEAGTTRDELRAALRVRDLVFVLSDTAGFEDAADELSGKAVAKAAEAIGRADLALLAMDATAPSYDRMEDILGLVTAPMIVVVTKCDLAPPERARAWLAGQGVRADVIATSAVSAGGLEELREALVRAVEGGQVDREASGPVLTARHRAALEQAALALARAARLARRGRGAEELIALELRESLEALSVITGRQADGDVLSTIFSRFCIGK